MSLPKAQAVEIYIEMKLSLQCSALMYQEQSQSSFQV